MKNDQTQERKKPSYRSILKIKFDHFWKNLKNKTVLSFAKYVIVLTALLHLVLSSIHIEALFQLETQLCGLWMFFFILLGLGCLFNAIRNTKGKISTTIFSILMLLLTCAAGVVLMTYYFKGMAEQPNIQTGSIIKAIVLSIVMIVFYAVGGVLTVIGMIKNIPHNKKIIEQNE